MSYALVLAGALLTSAPRARAAELEGKPAPQRVWHTPIASALADAPLTVQAEVRDANRLSELVLHYRHHGEQAYSSASFARATTDDLYTATVPSSDMTPGVLEYYISSRASEGAPEIPYFAHAVDPHSVIVLGDRETRRRQELLARHLGNRSRFQLESELVDFGARGPAGRSLPDYYWRVEGDYTYRILGPAYSIRLGAGVLRGHTFEKTADMQGQITLAPVDRVGLTYGFAELRLRLGRVVRLDLRTTLGAGPQHFDAGAGAALVIGNDPGTHFAFGVDGVSTIGARGFLRLAWNTVPRVPMSFTIEVTNLPNNGDVSGRVFLGAGHRFGRHVLIDAQLGYATRDFRIGGPSLGLGGSFEF